MLKRQKEDTELVSADVTMEVERRNRKIDGLTNLLETLTGEVQEVQSQLNDRNRHI